MTIALLCIVTRAVCAMQHVEHPAAKQPANQPAKQPAKQPDNNENNNQCDTDSSTYVAGSFERDLFSKAVFSKAGNGQFAKHHAATAWNAGTAAAAATAATFLVKNISVGQSGALVQEWIVGAGTNHEFHLMFKHTEGSREPSFYKSDLYQRYSNVSKHSLLIYHVEEDNSVKNKTWFNILMEKGGIHYPGGPRSRYVVPRADPTSAAFKTTDDHSVVSGDNDKMERFKFAQHWVPAIIDELARFHSLFWQHPDLKPQGFYLSITKLLVDVMKDGDLLEKASRYFNIADKDPTTKIKKYPFLSGFGRLGMFEALQTNVGLIKGPQLWTIGPFADGLEKAASDVDKRYGLLKKIGDFLSNNLGVSSKTYTLCHNDFKNENFLLRYAAAANRNRNETNQSKLVQPVVQMFDWDLVGTGSGPADLGVMMVTSLNLDLRVHDNFEMRMLQEYTRLVWARMAHDIRKNYYGEDFSVFKRQVYDDYFKKTPQTLLVMNFLESQGEKRFTAGEDHGLLANTLSWFHQHRHYFGFTFQLGNFNREQPAHDGRSESRFRSRSTTSSKLARHPNLRSTQTYLPYAINVIDQSDKYSPTNIHKGILLDPRLLALTTRDITDNVGLPNSVQRDAGLNYALAQISLANSQRKAGRMYLVDGDDIIEIIKGQQLLSILTSQYSHGAEVMTFIVTDGASLSLKYGDHNVYQVGDFFLKPAYNFLIQASTWCFKMLETLIGVDRVKYFRGAPKDPPRAPLVLHVKKLLTGVGLDTLVEEYNPEDKVVAVADSIGLSNDVFFIVSHPILARAVLERPDKRVPTTIFGDVSTMAAKGVFIADGQMWEMARSTFETTLTPTVIHDLIEYFSNNSQRMIKRIKESVHESRQKGESVFNDNRMEPGVVDANSWIEAVTYDSMAEVGFGYLPDEVSKVGKEGMEEDTFIKLFDEALQSSLSSIVNPFAQAPFYQGKEKQLEIMSSLNEFLDEKIVGQLHQKLSERKHRTLAKDFDVGDIVSLDISRVEVVEWLRTNGCPWDEETCSRSAHAAQKSIQAKIVAVRQNGGYRLQLTDFVPIHGSVNDEEAALGRNISDEWEQNDTRGMTELIQAAKPLPLLAALMQKRCPATKMGFSNEALRDQVTTMLVAGHKTTTLLLEWSIYHLARNKYWQRKLFRELQREFGVESIDGQTSIPGKEIHNLKDMKQFMDEVLRLASPVQTVQRSLTQDVLLHSDIDLATGQMRKSPSFGATQYLLKAGGQNGKGNSFVFVHLMGIHRQKDLWGEDAFDFNPDRWAPENLWKMKYGKSQFLPFGGGKRSCLGNLFAVTQTKTILANMIRLWKFDIGRDLQGKEIKVKIDPDDLAAVLSMKRAKQRAKGEQGGLFVKLEDRSEQEWLSYDLKNDEDLRREHCPSSGHAEATEEALTKSSINIPDGESGDDQVSSQSFSHLVIVFGSQFGTTEEDAKKYRAKAKPNFSGGVKLIKGNELVRNQVSGDIYATFEDEIMTNYLGKQTDDDSRTLMVFLTPVYNGHPADNMILLFMALRAGVQSDRLPKFAATVQERLSFSVLAIGNGNWGSTFTAAGVELDKDLLGKSGLRRYASMEVLDQNSPNRKRIARWQKRIFYESGDLYNKTPDDGGLFRTIGAAIGLLSKSENVSTNVADVVLAESPPRYIHLNEERMARSCTADDCVEAARNKNLILKQSGFMEATIVKNDELVLEKFRPKLTINRKKSVRDLTIQLSFETLKQNSNSVVGNPPASNLSYYEPGDLLEVHTEMSASTVNFLCSRFGWDPEAVIQPDSNRDPAERDEIAQLAASKKLFVKDVLMLYVDVTKPPSPEAVAGLLEFSSLDKSTLEWTRNALTMEHDASDSSDDKLSTLTDNIYDWWTRYGGGHSFVAALDDLKIFNLSFARFLEIVPKQRTRLYSIASAYTISPSEKNILLKLCVGRSYSEENKGSPYSIEDLAAGINDKAKMASSSVNKAETKRYDYDGLASGMLSERSRSSDAQNIIYVRIKTHTHMRVPSSEVPIMMVATGTGIAPFMGFLEQRKKNSFSLVEERTDVLNTLYYGVREKYDFIFENKLRQYTKKNILQLKVSFSRASATAVEKIHKEMLSTGNLQNMELMAKSYVSHFIQNDAGKKFYVACTLPDNFILLTTNLFQYRLYVSYKIFFR